MLSFAAFVPTNPVLIPSIGKEHAQCLVATSEAMTKLAKALANAKPEVLVILAYPAALTDAFVISFAPEHQGNLEVFGEFATKVARQGEAVLGYYLKEQTGTKFPLTITSAPALPYTISVPLLTLAQAIPSVPILPLYASNQDLKIHYKFGQAMAQAVLENQKRMALIAAGDLAHCLTPDAPGGFNEKGAPFDQQIRNIVKSKTPQDIGDLDPALLTEVKEAGTRTLAMLLGALDGINYTPEILSYEGPLGVGHLVAQFSLPQW